MVRRLRDLRATRRIQRRIDRLELGLFGDVKHFDGIGELRIDYGQVTVSISCSAIIAFLSCSQEARKGLSPGTSSW